MALLMRRNSAVRRSLVWSSQRRSVSYTRAIQQSHSAKELLDLSVRRPPSPSEAAQLLWRLARVTPDSDANVRADRRLTRLLRASKFGTLKPSELSTVVWSLAMLRQPLLRSGDFSLASVTGLLEAAASDMEVHDAAQAKWGYQTLVACSDEPEKAPASSTPRLSARAATLPFTVHLGAVSSSLLCIDELLAEVAPRREEITSGSAMPSQDCIAERRLTAWQSEAGASFKYSGKVMEPRVGGEAEAGLSPRVVSIRNAVRATLGQDYDSVLLNHYQGRRSGMNFHSDPGQGAEGGWDFSTSVVSAGACRRIVFRRIGSPQLRCTFRLQEGDVLEMRDGCQQQYQHSVATEEHEVGPRVSLVFKRTWSGRSERERTSHDDV
jgi:alkylated DNA repair dioxygenase AlkB